MEHQRRANGKKIPAEVLKKRKQERVMRAAFLVLTVLLVIGVYSAVSAAGSRFHWKVDLTEGQVFQITDTTEEILAELSQDVAMICCNARGDADSNIVQVLSGYEAATPRIRVDYADLSANPAFVETCAQKDIALSEDGVLVASGERAQFIAWNDLYEIKTYADANGGQKYALTGLRAESRLTAAIVRVTAQETVGVAFTAGHSEDAPEALKELIAGSNYAVEQVVLGVDGIGPTVRTVVVAGAKRDFSQQEIDILADFMDGGGNLMVFRDPKVASLPNLDAYLQEWGLAVEDQFVLEPRQQMDGPLNIIPVFGVSMINVYFSEHSTYLVLPGCRGLSLENVNGCITNEVLRSTSVSYGKRYQDMQSLSPEETDTAGPFTVAATSERSVTGSGESRTQYVFLTACTGLYQEGYLKTESLGNADFPLQVLGYMNDQEVALNIPTKNLAANAISISWSATMLFAVLFAGVLPLGFLAMGMVVFLKRRHS